MKQYRLQDLLEIMEQLRAGCPWDKEQTYESLKRYVIEEAYEVVDAVDEPDRMCLADELGDLLLQVVFYAQLGKEDGSFSMEDVLRCVCEKMIRRHPHVFGTVKAETSEEVLTNWAQIKKQEKGQKTLTQTLEGVSVSLPALMRAQKVQDSAVKAGAWEEEGYGLIKEAEHFSHAKTPHEREEALGRLLFAAVLEGRRAGVQPETALQQETGRFIREMGQKSE